VRDDVMTCAGIDHQDRWEQALRIGRVDQDTAEPPLTRHLFIHRVSDDVLLMARARSVSRVRRSVSQATAPSRAQAALRKGSEALAHGRWQEARTWFERAATKSVTPEALEGLGTAAWWLDNGGLVFKARERAFQLYRQRGDRRGAGRLATALAGDYLQFRGEAAVARGWHRRAQRLLNGLPPAPEHGWLHLSEADLALAAGVTLLTCAGSPSERRP
jgi:hypothetical protein